LTVTNMVTIIVDIESLQSGDENDDTFLTIGRFALCFFRW